MLAFSSSAAPQLPSEKKVPNHALLCGHSGVESAYHALSGTQHVKPQEANMTTWTPAIQYIETYPNEQTAREGLEFLATQVDYLDGRLMPPNAYDQPKWRTQTIFESNGGELPLPDCCRHVLWRGHF
jgi:hypothetical protein